jgi:hypothetical protein
MTRNLRIYALAVLIAIVTAGCGNVAEAPPTQAPPIDGAPPSEKPPLTAGSEPPHPAGEQPPPPPPAAARGGRPPMRNGTSRPPTIGAPSPEPAPHSRIRDQFDKVDAVLGELVSGNVAFNTPERMGFRESRTITLIASPEMNQESLGARLRERIGGGDPISVEALQIAPLMEARLEGASAFEVIPLTPGRQPVGRAAPTEWRWNVRANEAGTQTLHLTIDAIVTVDGERFPRSLNVLDRRIEVEITAVQQFGMFVESNWQWVAGTIVIPLGVWWWTNRKKRRVRS